MEDQMGDFVTLRSLVRAADEIIAAIHKGDLTPDEAAAAWQAERATQVTTFEWLIERGQAEGQEPTVWLEHSIRHPARDVSWTTDANEAAMFPDRETAERYIADEGIEAAKAVEHGYMRGCGYTDEPCGCRLFHSVPPVRRANADCLLHDQEGRPVG